MFPVFSSVWDYVPTLLPLLQATWQKGMRWMQSGRRRSCGPESTRSSNNHVRKRWDRWQRSKGLPDATWRHGDRLSSSTWRPRDRDLTATVKPNLYLIWWHAELSGASDLHQTGEAELDVDCGRGSWVWRRHTRDVRSSSEGARGRKSWDTIPTILHDRTVANRCHFGSTWRRVEASRCVDLHRTDDERGAWSHDQDRPTNLIRSDGSDYIGPTIMAHDRGSIVARSPCDRGWFRVQFGATTPPIDGQRCPLDRGHQSAPRTASNGQNFRVKIPYKTGVFLLFSIQLLINSWR